MLFYFFLLHRLQSWISFRPAGESSVNKTAKLSFFFNDEADEFVDGGADPRHVLLPETHHLYLQCGCDGRGDADTLRWGVSIICFWEAGRRRGGGGGGVEEEVERGGGVPPDSLEPCCNSLIETEWDVLITPVVKTEGGGWRQGGCVLWSPGSGSPTWGGTPPINTDALWWGASRDSTRTRTRTRTPPADLHLHSGFTLQDQTSALCSHERTLFYRVDGPEQPAGRDRRRLRLWTHHLWDALRESAGLLLQTKDCWEFTRTGREQEPEPGRTQSAAPNLTRQQPRYVQNNQNISADPFLLRLEY